MIPLKEDNTAHSILRLGISDNMFDEESLAALANGVGSDSDEEDSFIGDNGAPTSRSGQITSKNGNVMSDASTIGGGVGGG